MNRQFTEEEIQEFLAAWKADFNEVISVAEARVQAHNIITLITDVRATVQRHADAAGMSLEDFVNLPFGDEGTSGM